MAIGTGEIVYLVTWQHGNANLGAQVQAFRYRVDAERFRDSLRGSTRNRVVRVRPVA
jgi:hypothetical protein